MSPKIKPYKGKEAPFIKEAKAPVTMDNHSGLLIFSILSMVFQSLEVCNFWSCVSKQDEKDLIRNGSEFIYMVLSFFYDVVFFQGLGGETQRLLDCVFFDLSWNSI